jgi:hypothetical protein
MKKEDHRLSNGDFVSLTYSSPPKTTVMTTSY